MKYSLRHLTENDLEKTMRWRMLPDVTKYMNTDPVLTIRQQRQWFERISADQTVKYWMIQADKEDAGVINLADIDIAKKESNWAYYVGEKKLRSFELAVTLEWNLYDYVFEILGLERLYNEVLCANKGVINLHKFCGSKIDEIYPEHVEKNGVKYDVAAISITSKEWADKKKDAQYQKIVFPE